MFLSFFLPPAAAQNPDLQNPTPEPPTKYSYYYHGKLVQLTPSTRLVALEEKGTAFAQFVSENGLVRDPLSNRESLRSRTLGLYRLPTLKNKPPAPKDLAPKIQAFARLTTHTVQPVFEQGPALLIPSDELIIGFKTATTLNQAQDFLTPYLNRLGIAELKPHRKNSFILKIRTPNDGRCYQVCRFLSSLDRVAFAEPNHLFIMLYKQNQLNKIGPTPSGTIELAATPTNLSSPEKGEPGTGPAPAQVYPTWATLATLDFESPPFPPAGWVASWIIGATQATWGRTDYRSHNGSYSIYCALNGSAGVSPPGPAPRRMQAVLRSPVYDLSSYEEVYVELWFYAINDMSPEPGGTLYDYPSVYVFDLDAGYGIGVRLGSLAYGDCTTDPTTDSGWRRCLFRVPPDYRVSQAFFDFRYNSDNIDQYEGAYLDDIRIVGTADVDTEPLGNDSYGARIWELRNVGQIAGLGNDDNDLHAPEAWNLVTLSNDVVVAIIDSGVELSHPDLHLVTSYEYDGSVAGVGHDRGNHATACAGEAGAIRNNSIGVIGVAPNVNIMSVYSGSTTSNVADAIDVAVAHGANVLSNSWGWVGAPSTTIENAITDALAAGSSVVCAAGNGPDRSPWTYDVVFPANLTGSTDVICVGCSSPTDEHKATASSDGQYHWGSSYVGDGPDVCTPGCWSYTTDRQGSAGYNDGSDLSDPDYVPDFGGTSSSTPKLAGIAALLLSANITLSPAQVKKIIRATADDMDVPGVDDKTGAGRANAYRAVRSLSTVDPHSSPQADRELPAWYDTEGEKMSVLKFKITDHGEDSLDTMIDQLIIDIGGTGGHAANDIAWAQLYDDTSSTPVATASSITDTQIIFGSTPNSDDTAQLHTIPDNSTIEYTVYIYLHTSLLAGEGDTYIFDIDETNVGVDEGNSSQMWGDTGSITPVVGTIVTSQLGVSVSPSTWSLGPVPVNYIGESGTFFAVNEGIVAEDFSLKGSDGDGGWTLENSVGQDAFKVEIDIDDNDSYELILATTDQTLATNIDVGTTQTFGLRYNAPSSDTKGGGIPQDFIVTITASMYVP